MTSSAAGSPRRRPKRSGWRTRPRDLEVRIEALTGESIAAAETATAAAAHERAGEEALRATEAKLAELAEIMAAAREARAGAVARAENQESRRIEMARISGEKFECPPPLLPEKLGFKESEIAEVSVESSRLERHSQDRERIGPVNLVAEAELNELEESRTSSPGRARGAGRRHPPPARLDRQPQSRGPSPPAHRLPGGRPPFPQPVHHPVRRRPGASRAGRIRRSARGRTRDHGAAPGQASFHFDAAFRRRAGADRDRPDLRSVPDQSGADLRPRRGRRAARRRQYRALLRPARPR